MMDERLEKQLRFVIESDKLKAVLRRTYNLGAPRRENSAEHSWQLALMAVVLAEHAEERVDVAHVVQMVLVHDMVEIDAGDTYAYAAYDEAEKVARERAAAARVFGLLPDEQAAHFQALWEEFEAAETAEARFAATLDRLMPLLLNYHSGGRSWQEHGVKAGQVHARNLPGRAGSETLWQYGEALIRRAAKEGLLETDG